ncbi:MAG: transporter substrate-binding domain-containing protein [Bacteroidales bacterium]|nr:transporter substrate-binding domain-containing protein [Bacteroidales bacterium]
MRYHRALCCLLLATIVCTDLLAQDSLRKELIIKGDIHYSPYEFLNEDGEADGYNVELTKALMEELGYECDIEVIDWGIATNMLKNREIDMLMGATFSLERLEYFNYSTPHSYIRQCFVYKGDKKRIKSLEELINKKIVVQSNTLAHQILKTSGISNSIIEYTNITDGLRELASGKYDVAICEENIVKYLIKHYNIQGLQYSIISDVKPIQYCFVVNKDEPELLTNVNQGLEALKANGTYDKIYSKWFSSSRETHTVSLLTRIIITLVVLLLLLATLTAVIIRILVIRSTKKLKIFNSELAMALKAGNISTWTYNIKSNCFYPLYGKSIFPKDGMRIEYLIKYINPSDLRPFVTLINELSSGEKRSGHYVMRYRKEDENIERYYEFEMTFVDEIDDNNPYLLGTYKDITIDYLYQKEMENSRRKIELAVTTSNLILWEYYTSTKSFSAMNDPTNNYKRNSHISKEEYLSLIHPDDIPITLQYFDLMDKGLQDNFSFTLRIRNGNCKEGEYLTMITNGSALEKDEYGKIIKYIGFRRDVTELNNMINQLTPLKDKAERSDKLKSAFLANVSHEIRTPLNAIIGFSEIMMNCTDEEEKRQYISIIKKNNRFLISLIDSIMDLAKIESGNLELKPYDFDFASMFKELGIEYSQKIPNENVQLICEVPDNHLLVCLDKERVSQIITNFLSNAIKFTEPGEIKMSYIHEKRGIRIIVSDTGCGVPAKDIDKLFDRFEKLNKHTRGSGIGLSITKAIVKAMNGDVGAESSPDNGSTFWAYIPLY